MISTHKKTHVFVHVGFVVSIPISIQQRAGVPADAFRAGAEFFECAILNLSNTLFTDAKQVANLPEAVRAGTRQAETKIKNLAFAWPQVFHQEGQRFLAFGIVLFRLRVVVGHRFGQFEIAVIVEDSIQADGSAGCGLEMREVFETGTSAAGEFLRAGKMLAAVGQGFRFLLQQTEFLQVMWAETHQMALASDRDLQRLANPPRGIRGQPRAVADVETINRLHQTTDRFLQQIGIAQRMVTESLGDVGGQADVGRGEPVLVMHIAIIKPANGSHFAEFGFLTMIADEVGHRPWFERWTMSTQIGEMAHHRADEFTFTIPEVSQKLAFFIGRQQVGRKGHQGRWRIMFDARCDEMPILFLLG